MGIASLVIGIIGISISFIPFVNYIVLIPAIVGLIVGIVDVAKKSKIKDAKKGEGIAGIVLNSVSIFIIIVWTFICIFLISSIAPYVHNKIEEINIDPIYEDFDYNYLDYDYDEFDYDYPDYYDEFDF